MKTVFRLFILAAICFLSSNTYAQDVITKKDGSDVDAKILEVTPTEIKYKRFDNQSGPTFTLLISDVLLVKYENGTRDTFNQNNNNLASNESDNPYDLIEQGKQDAVMNYKGKNSGKGGVVATNILLGPLLGLIPAAIITSSEPQPENLRAPNPELMRNPSYNKGYTEQAEKIKKKKVWKAYGISAGVVVVLVVAAYSVAGASY